MSDPLKNFEFPESEGLFLKLEKGGSVKLRVLTTDPLVSYDNYGNMRFSFVVWNWDAKKAQILSKGNSIARALQQLHNDEDYGANIQEIDLKITAVSTGSEKKDVEYSVNPLPKAQKITDEILEEVKKVDLEKAIKDGKRMSALSEGEELAIPESVRQASGVDDNRDDSAKDEVVIDDIDDEPVDLSDIPF